MDDVFYSQFYNKTDFTDPIDQQTYLNREYCEQDVIHEEIENLVDPESEKDSTEVINTEYSNIGEVKKEKITIESVKRSIKVIVDFLKGTK